MSPLPARLALLSAVAIAVLAAPSKAQTLQGMVLSEKGHLPIASAHLFLVDDSGRVVDRQPTDTSGAFYFDLQRPGRYSVRILIGRGGVSETSFFRLDSNQTVDRMFVVPDWPKAVLEAYLPDDVTKQAAELPDQPRPRYPDRMRVEGHSGLVRARFVIDVGGRADMSTFQALSSDDPSFADAVRKMVSDSRFGPAERDGSKVSQVFDLAVDFGFGNDPPRATGRNVMVIRAFSQFRAYPSPRH